MRVILAYYFSLLKTSIELGDKTRFLNLLILDEPKQQNIDEHAFESFLQQTKTIPSKDWQVIITTFRGEEHLKEYNLIKISSDESKFLIKKLKK